MKLLSVVAIGRRNHTVSGALGGGAESAFCRRHGRVSLAGLSPHGVPLIRRLPIRSALPGGNAVNVSGSATQPLSLRRTRWLPLSVATVQPRRSVATRRTYSLLRIGSAVSAGPLARG